MEAYPMLREEVDRIVSEHIRNSEGACKEHVRYQINFELSYINTNHEVILFLNIRSLHIFHPSFWKYYESSYTLFRTCLPGFVFENFVKSSEIWLPNFYNFGAFFIMCFEK